MMERCRVTKKVVKYAVVNGKRVRLSGIVRCSKKADAHIYNPEIPHAGTFNREDVLWKPTEEEKEAYTEQRV